MKETLRTELQDDFLHVLYFSKHYSDVWNCTVSSILSTQGGNSLSFMMGVIMSGHFLGPANTLTKFSKTPNMLTKFSGTKLSPSPKFNPSQNHIIIALLKYQADSELETPNNYFPALKISDPKYVNLPSILDPKYLFQSLSLRPQICSSFLSFRSQICT